MDGMFNPGLFGADQTYGQGAWPGRLAKRASRLLIHMPFKLLLPVLPTP